MTTKPVKLVQDVSARDSNPDKDSKIKDGYVEIIDKNRTMIVKRMGYLFYIQMPLE